jgi:RHS repeat-associated protein
MTRLEHLSEAPGVKLNKAAGLDYFGARYFSAAMGRFTSPDRPLVDQHPDNPQSWNLYSYVRDSPLRYTDPSGEGSVEQQQAEQEYACRIGASDCHSSGQSQSTTASQPTLQQQAALRTIRPESCTLAMNIDGACGGSGAGASQAVSLAGCGKRVWATDYATH